MCMSAPFNDMEDVRAVIKKHGLENGPHHCDCFDDEEIESSSADNVYCDACGENLAKYFCNGCNIAVYCSPECQKEHWNAKEYGHKSECEQIAEAVPLEHENLIEAPWRRRWYWRRPWWRRRWGFRRGWYRPWWWWW